MMFPMWVLPISVFLAMSGSPKSHQELHDEGMLVQSGAQFSEMATGRVVPCAGCCTTQLERLSPNGVTQVGSGHALPVHCPSTYGCNDLCPRGRERSTLDSLVLHGSGCVPCAALPHPM